MAVAHVEAQIAPFVILVRDERHLERFGSAMQRLFEDYLRRSREPFTASHLWQAIRVGLAAGTLFFLVAFDERIRPVGYLLAQPGRDFYGITYANIVGLYIRPGTQGVLEQLDRLLRDWASSIGVQVTSAMTLRKPAVFSRFIKRFGFQPYAVSYVRLEQEDVDGRR